MTSPKTFNEEASKVAVKGLSESHRVPVYRERRYVNGDLARVVGKIYNCSCNINLYPTATHHGLHCKSWWNYTEHHAINPFRGIPARFL